MTRFRSISVIVPTLNDASVAATVQSILANEPPLPFELFVAGRDESGRLRAFPRVRFLDTGRPRIPSAARNLAAAQAAGDLFLFTDADCVVDRDWIAQALTAMGDEREVVGGGIRFPEDNYWELGDNVAVFHRCHVSGHPRPVRDYVGSNNLAVTRRAFEAVGGFDGELWIGEDWDFLKRLRAQGLGAWFEPGFAVTHHSGRTTRERLLEHARSYGAGYVKLLRRGTATSGRWRADRCGRWPLAAAAWSAARACSQTLRTFAGTPSMLRYLRVLPVVWLFHYARRREVFRVWHTPDTGTAQ